MSFSQNLSCYKNALVLLIILTLILIVFIRFEHMDVNIPFRRQSFRHKFKCLIQDEKCDIFSGKWVSWPEGPYYTNKTQCVIDERQNCMMNGRPDIEFMKWRWQPDECELARFEGAQFLEIVRGKSMAFVGDSLARNQMQSLGCLLSGVTRYINETNTNGESFLSWYYPDYEFTLANFSSVHLVKSNSEFSSTSKPMHLYLDEADMTWAAHIEKFDYVIISSAHWFTKPLIFHNKGKIVGCNMCKRENVTELDQYYGYRMAMETAFRTLVGLKNFKGKVFLRTVSPTHFEPEKVKGVGFCARKEPFKKENIEFNWLIGSYYMFQNEEFRVAKIEGKRRDLKFDLLDITDAMSLRPDGHPNNYGKGNYTDCLHWCLPGPVDTWNEFLFHKLKLERLVRLASLRQSLGRCILGKLH